jgi:hypothetical protein
MRSRRPAVIAGQRFEARASVGTMAKTTRPPQDFSVASITEVATPGTTRWNLKRFQDFVIAHELLHLRVPNHGKVFKALMTAHVPRWREHEKHRLAGKRSGVSR